MNSPPISLNTSICALIFLSVFSCSVQGTTFNEAANQYCGLYAPDAWGVLGEDPELQDIYAFITIESRKIKNSNFINALNKADTNNFSSFFVSVRTNIEEHLGTEWQCDHFDNFFYPKQKVVSLTVGNVYEKHIDPNANDVLVITLLASGVTLVNNSPLNNSTTETLSHALNMVLKDKGSTPTEVYLYFDEGADGNRISQLLMLLNGLGIRSVGLIHYPS